VVAALDLQPGDRVLEIGFGHGCTLAAVAARADRGRVIGVDPSEVMVRQASRRNRRAVTQGRVALHRAGVEAIPCGDAAFDKAFAVNSFQHWPDPLACLVEVKRVLTPGGTHPVPPARGVSGGR
jgi:ubiquinone/menaquinone biosynthesis C-methylase UbiE